MYQVCIIVYHTISAKSNYQFEKPFVWLLKKLLGDPNLVLVEAPVLAPREFDIDPNQIREMEDELNRLLNDWYLYKKHLKRW